MRRLSLRDVKSSLVISLLLALAACREQTSPGAQKAAEQKGIPVEIKAADKPLQAGDSVSDFAAVAHTGERALLSRYAQRPVLVYFCASDAAAPCKDLAEAVRDAWLRLNPHLSMVFGVSRDDMALNSAFASEQHLPFLMLSDTAGKVKGAFGFSNDEVVSFLIGSDRKLLRVFHPANGREHVDAVISALRELQLLRPEYPK